LPGEVVEKILFHLAHIRGLLGDGAKPYSDGSGTADLAPDS